MARSNDVCEGDEGVGYAKVPPGDGTLRTACLLGPDKGCWVQGPDEPNSLAGA